MFPHHKEMVLDSGTIVIDSLSSFTNDEPRVRHCERGAGITRKRAGHGRNKAKAAKKARKINRK